MCTPDARRHERAVGTCAFVRASSTISIRDDILFRDRYAVSRGVDRFLKWRGDTDVRGDPVDGCYARASQSTCHSTCLPGPYYPFPAINMEFRARSPVSRRRSGHRPVPRPETTEFSRSRARHAHCLHRLCSFR